MYQIDNSTAVASIPASTGAGTAGFFTDGNPATGVPATILPAEFMNMLMMENLNLLSAAGIAPSKTNFSQLATAIRSIIQSAGSTFGQDVGTANALVVNLAPAVTTLVDGMLIRVIVVATNTGATTLNLNGLGVKNVNGLGDVALQGGELIAGGRATLMWAATQNRFILQSCQAGALAIAPATKNLHALQAVQAQAGFGLYAVDGASPNVYSANYTPVIAALVDGMSLRFKAQNANTGASTFSPSGLTPKAIVGLAGAALQGGEITSAGTCTVLYSLALDKWVLTSCSGGALQIPPGTQSQHAMQVGQATGRLIGIQRIASSGTYTPTSGTNSIIVDQTGAGGGGGGVPATAGGQLSVGGGGGSGARAMSRFTSGFSGVTVTIGTGGTAGAIGGNGGNGGQTSFGALLITAGGLGGTAGPASSAAPLGAVGGDGGALPTLGNMLNMAGQPGQAGVALSANSFFSGAGANSCFGGGGGRSIPTNTSPGIAARGPGAGGGGGANGASSAGQIGGVGGDGSVLVYEYS